MEKNHEVDGRSNVYRAGRFGIGLLAAYLLGEELQVETRHISQDETKALLFKCRKGSESITVSHTEFDHVGTRITIKISNEVRSALLRGEELWDWFALSDPKVIRRVLGKSESNLEQSRTVPNANSDINDTHWHRISSDDYDDILWTYERVGKSGYSSLICNGIVITNNLQLDNFDIEDKIGVIDIDPPSINVFDQDGRLPINLQRSDLVSPSLPFQLEMARDVSDYFAKKMISLAKNIGAIRLRKEILRKLNYIGIEGLEKGFPDTGYISKFLIHDEKLIPFDYDLIAKAKIKKVYIDRVDFYSNKGTWTSSEFARHCNSYLFVNPISKTEVDRAHFIKNVFGMESSRLSALPVSGRRMLIKKNDVKKLFAGYVSKKIWSTWQEEWDNDNWSLFSVGCVPEIDLNIETVTKELDESNSFGFICYYFDWDKVDENENPSLFSQAWLKANDGQLFIDNG